jgi:hypothetical protein
VDIQDMIMRSKFSLNSLDDVILWFAGVLNGQVDENFAIGMKNQAFEKDKVKQNGVDIVASECSLCSICLNVYTS